MAVEKKKAVKKKSSKAKTVKRVVFSTLKKAAKKIKAKVGGVKKVIKKKPIVKSNPIHKKKAVARPRKKRASVGACYLLLIRKSGKDYFFTGKDVIFDDDLSKALCLTKSQADMMREPLNAHYKPRKMRVLVVKKK